MRARACRRKPWSSSSHKPKRTTGLAGKVFHTPPDLCATHARGVAMVYVDYLQNIIGKTVAAAYSARANPEALVSTPLEWAELANDLDPREFTIQTAPARFAEKGDIWAAQLKRKNSLRALV
ncbi:MAG: hypothetical protein ABIZ36_05805 [Gemmatimonadaceae bacterium]